MDWRDFPSLAALRAFEAAATHGSYTAAARALNVSHAAIAQHVRALEDHFGRALMRRDGQQMRPTQDGARLALSLTDGFEAIARGVQDLKRQTAHTPLRVATTHSFAEHWLVPRIGAFWTAYPDISLELLPSPALLDLRRDSIDVALRYGRGSWPGLDATPLVAAGHTVVAAPGHVAGDTVETLEQLSAAHWLLLGAREEEHLWLRDHGLNQDSLRITFFDTGSLVIQAVRAGNGISVQPKAIVARDIEMGVLVSLYEEDPGDLAYYIVTRPNLVSDRLRIFIRWLKAQP